MSFRRIKFCMLTAAVAGLFSMSARAADGHKPVPAPAPAPAVAPGAGGCGYTTVRTIEMVPEYVPVTRTVCRPEWRTENYTAYRTEVVPEVRTRQVTVMRPVTETVMETRCVTQRVPVVRTVTTMQTKWVNQVCTEMRTKRVRHVNHVQECVPVQPGLLARCRAKKDPCACPPCPQYKTVSRRVVCHETVCCPVTVCKKVKVCVPCTKQVCTYQCVTRTVQVPVCRTRCVPECRTEKYTVCTTRCVPVQCTRKVCVNVPHQVTERVCRMVPKCVERQVPCAPACAPACGPVCGNECCAPACNPCCAPAKARRMGGLFNGFSRLCGKRNSGCCDGGFIAAAPTGCCN
jgi:hypothetical protein